jgi:hypothetical protein
MIILTIVNIFAIAIIFVEIAFFPIYSYIVIPQLLLFLPILVFFFNALTSLFFDIAKKRVFQKAQKLMKKINIHTIAIT